MNGGAPMQFPKPFFLPMNFTIFFFHWFRPHVPLLHTTIAHNTLGIWKYNYGSEKTSSYLYSYHTRFTIWEYIVCLYGDVHVPSRDSLMIYYAVCNLGNPWEDHQYFPHVCIKSTCCSMHKNVDSSNSGQNKLKSQVNRHKTFGLWLGFRKVR